MMVLYSVVQVQFNVELMSFSGEINTNSVTATQQLNLAFSQFLIVTKKCFLVLGGYSSKVINYILQTYVLIDRNYI